MTRSPAKRKTTLQLMLKSVSFNVYGFLLQRDSRNQHLNKLEKRSFEEKHDYKQCTKATKAVVL